MAINGEFMETMTEEEARNYFQLRNLKIGRNYKNKLVYLVGKSEKELLACDEYDSYGDGKWFTDNPVMAEEFNHQGAFETAEREGLDIFMREVAFDINEKKIVKDEIWLQFTNEEAIKWKKAHIKNAVTENTQGREPL